MNESADGLCPLLNSQRNLKCRIYRGACEQYGTPCNRVMRRI
jgi:hypothetical protein